MHTVAVINHKGGSGKTTSAVNLAAALGERGLRVLVLDLDPQGSATAWLGGTPGGRELFDAFMGWRELAGLAVDANVRGVSIIPASGWLVTVERTLQRDLAVGVSGAVRRLPEDWQIVLMDCPPSIAFLGLAALSSCRQVLIPVEARALALPGVASVLGAVDRVRSTANPDIDVAGVVVGRMDRTRHARDAHEALRRDVDGLLFDTTIRESVRVAEAAAAGVPITRFAPVSVTAQEYRAAATELLGRLDPPRQSEP